MKLSTHKQRWKDCSKCSGLEHPCGFIRKGIGNNKSTGLHTAHGFSILFLGEAPGESEQALGTPFVGRSGKLLDSIISQANDHLTEQTCTVCDGSGYADSKNYCHFCLGRGQVPNINPTFANVISCRPPGNRNPTKEEILNCRPKLLETIAIVNPMAVVCVGAIAKQAWTDIGREAIRIQSKGGTSRTLHRELAGHTNIAVLSPREIQRVVRVLIGPRINIKHPAAILRAPEQVQVFETAEAVCDLVCFVQDQLVKETTK